MFLFVIVFVALHPISTKMGEICTRSRVRAVFYHTCIWLQFRCLHTSSLCVLPVRMPVNAALSFVSIVHVFCLIYNTRKYGTEPVCSGRLHVLYDLQMVITHLLIRWGGQVSI